MIELFKKTREEIQMDVTRVCEERRLKASKGPVKSTSGNLLVDSVMNILARDGHATTDEILFTLKQKGMRHIVKEDLDNLSDPLLLCIGDTWFKRRPGRSVYVYADQSIDNIPGATRERDCIWNCPLTEDLVEFYREEGNRIMILDEDIQRMFDVLYTPREKMKKEILSELVNLYD